MQIECEQALVDGVHDLVDGAIGAG